MHLLLFITIAQAILDVLLMSAQLVTTSCYSSSKEFTICIVSILFRSTTEVVIVIIESCNSPHLIFDFDNKSSITKAPNKEHASALLKRQGGCENMKCKFQLTLCEGGIAHISLPCRRRWSPANPQFGISL